MHMMDDALAQRLIALNRAFARIKSSKLRRRLIDLITTIADSDRS